MPDMLYRGLKDFMEANPSSDRDGVEVRFEGEEYGSEDELAAALDEYIDSGELVYADELSLDDEEDRDRIDRLPGIAADEAVLERGVGERSMEFYCDPEDGLDQLVDEAEKLDNYVFQKNDAISEFFATYDLVFTVRDDGDGLDYAVTLVSEEVEYTGCAGADYVFPGEVTVLAGELEEDLAPAELEEHMQTATVDEETGDTLADHVDVDPVEDEDGQNPFLRQGPGSERIQQLMQLDDKPYDEFEGLMKEVHEETEHIGQFIESYENFLEAFAEVHDWDEKFEDGQQLGETNVTRGYDESDLDLHRTKMRESLMEMATDDGAALTNIRDSLIFATLGANNVLYEDPEKRQRFRDEHDEVYRELANAGKQLSVTGISDLTATEVRPEAEFHDPTDVARVMRTMAQEGGNAVDAYLKSYEEEALRERERKESMGNEETAERMFQ